MSKPIHFKKRLFLGTMIFLVVFPLLITAWKMIYLGFTPDKVLPVPTWDMQLVMTMEGQQQKANLTTYLPQSSIREKLQNMSITKSDFTYHESQSKENIMARWSHDELEEREEFGYQVELQMQPHQFQISPQVLRPKKLKEDHNLKATQLIQVHDPQIKAKAADLGLDTLKYTLDILNRAFDYVQDSIRATNFSGETDALLTLNLGEASCNGKSRLLVALLRSQGIPTRLVGGVIVESGKKETIHQWVEASVEGVWVPMDALNRHKFELPIHYLSLYRGDLSLFKRTKNRNFQYYFEFSKRMEPKFDLDTQKYHWLEVYPFLKSKGIPAEMLTVLLMIPLGALITLIFRNIIGVSTFGTFLPALLAVAFRDTGLLFGLIGLFLVLLVGYGLRKFLDVFQLLHTPKLTFILTFLILSILSLTLIGVNHDIKSWSEVSLLPIVIITLTVERISIQMDENGFKPTLKKIFNTTIVIVFCYLGVRSEFLKILFSAFPEVLFIVMSLSLYFGRWDGLRVSEFFRFKKLLLQERASDD